MAEVTQTVLIEFDTNTGEVTKAFANVQGQLQKIGASAQQTAFAVDEIGAAASNAGRQLGQVGNTSSLNEVASSAKTASAQTKKIGDEAEDAKEDTEDLGKAGKKAGKDIKDGATLGARAFKTLGTAIKATGIGFLVGLLAKLIASFTKSKAVAEALGVAGAALGTIFNDIGTFVFNLGKTIFEAFTNPQQAVADLKAKFEGVGNYLKLLGSTIFGDFRLKLLEIKEGLIEGAIAAKEFFGGDATELKKSLQEVQDEQEKIRKTQEENSKALAEPFVAAAEAVSTYVSRTKDAVKQATDLERQLQRLRDAERDLSVVTAQSRAEVEELKRIRDDQNLSIEERIAAAEKAAEIDQRIADENVRIAEQRAALLRRELELQGETEEGLQAVADAEIAAADARAASAAVQTELQTSIFGLNAEAEAQRQEQEDADIERQQAELQRRKELAEALASEKELELMKLREDYEAKLALAREFGEGEEQLKEEFEAKKAEIEEKYAEETEERQKLSFDQQVQFATNALTALQALNDAFSKDDEASARRAFKRNKALALATATINTGQAVVNALTAGGNPIKLATGAQFVEAGIAAAMGAAQIATIAKSKFQGSAPPPPPGGGMSSAAGLGGGGQTQAPQLDLSFLGEGAGQAGPIQAYVVSENVSNAQQANQKIQEQASL